MLVLGLAFGLSYELRFDFSVPPGYFQNFMALQPYANSLKNIALTYREYGRLMKHWGKVLNIPILHVRYESVVDDLISDRKFRKSSYSILSVNSTDFNSMHILVRESVKEVNFKKMTFAEKENISKGSVLYSLAKLNDGFNYHIFLNLWPSRSEGNEYDRIRCAVAVRKEIDNILNFERDARIIVLGTFNDEPTNKSVLSILNASNKRKNIDYRDFYNPFYDLHNNSDSGTMVLNGTLQMYDYIVVSPQLIRKNKGYSIMFNSGEIIDNGSAQPLPTFRGDEYLGGASGHFPVIIRLKSQSSEDGV